MTLGNLSEAIRAVDTYKDGLKSKCHEFLRRLSELGVNTADVHFRSAQYDGVNDVVTYSKWENDKTVMVIAKGDAVTFIEFGSGVMYADNHPLASSMGMERGGYGEGRGSQRTWGYYGEPGTNGRVHGDKCLVLTHGNPASRAMYEASKEMRQRIMEIAKEVFTT